MKYFLLCIMAFVLMSCNNKPDDYVIMKYKFPSSDVQIMYLMNGNMKLGGKLDANGYMCDTLYNTPQYFYAFIGLKALQIYANPGDSVIINQDGYLMPATYGGNNATINKYLNSAYQRKQSSQFTRLLKSKENDFRILEDTLIKFRLESLSYLEKQKSKLPVDFVVQERKHIENKFLITLYGLNSCQKTDYSIKRREEVRNKIDFTSQLLWDRNKVERLYINKLLDQHGKVGALNSIVNLDVNNAIKTRCLSEYAKITFPSSSPEQLDHDFEIINQNITDTIALNKILKSYEDAKKMAVGTTITDFIMEDPEGKKVSLYDFKGKYIYIDFWASWCHPCRNQIPHLLSREHECANENENIVFLSISIDRKREDWLKAIGEMNVGENQFILQEDKSVLKALNVSMIPRFVLLDPNYKIVNSKAPKPSEKDAFYQMANFNYKN